MSPTGMTTTDAAFTRRAIAGSHGGVRGEIGYSASGSTIMAFIGTHVATNALLRYSVPLSCTILPTAVEPTNCTASIPGLSSIALTASPAPVDYVEDAVGSPACHFVAPPGAASPPGVWLLGFQMKRIPGRRAIGSMGPIGTITGKLNGVMPAVTPSSWRSVVDEVDAFRVHTRHVKSYSQANSTVSSPRTTSPSASG